MIGLRSVGLAVLCTAGCTLLKLAVPAIGAQVPYLLYFGAVLLAVVYGGRAGGLWASVLSALAANVLFLQPRGIFSINGAAVVQTATFLLEAVTVVILVDMAQKRKVQLDTVQRFTAALSSALRPEEVAALVVREGAEVLGAQIGALVVPRGPSALALLATHGVPGGVVNAFAEISVDAETPLAKAFRTGQPAWVESAEEYQRNYPGSSNVPSIPAAGAASLPLVARGRTIGAVGFRFARARALTPPLRALVSVLAEQAALALDRAVLQASEVDKRERLESLGLLGDELAGALDRKAVAEIIVERGRRANHADTCTLYDYDDADGSLVLLAQRGCAPAIVDLIQRIEKDAPGPSQRALAERASIWVESEQDYVDRYPEFAEATVEGRRAKAFWCVPLLAEGKPIGLLGMGYFVARRFLPEKRAFVEAFRRQCEQALDRARRVEGERRAREAAEQAKSWLETTLRSIGDAVIATDTKGAVTMMNPIACDLTGWTEAEAIGKPLRDVFAIVNEETRAEVESPVDKVLREGAIVALSNHTVLLGKRPGMETPIDDSGAPIRDAEGNVRGVVLVFRNVSESKRREARRTFLAEASAALAGSLDYAQTLARVTELAVPRLADWCAIEVLEDGELRQISVAHFDPKKVALAKELGQRYPTRLDAPAGAPNVIRTGKSEFYPEITDDLLVRGAVDEEHLRLSRELRLRSGLVVPLAGPRGIVGALTMVYAESERRYTADDLAFAEDFARRAAMAVETARLYATAQAERARADASNNAKDAFLATVSHELRTPLNAILGWTRMLAEARLPPPGDARALVVIERNAVAMTQLVEDILDVSRIISGKLRLDVAPTDLGAVVEAAVDTVRPAAEAKRVAIELRLDPATPSVLADPARLQQIVWNLVSNAIKFTPSGGNVEVVLARVDDRVELLVTDTGKGIDASFLPRIFEPFQQADGSPTREHGGLGLGLAITRHLVELHGGTIGVRGNPSGGGAQFVVRLPVSPR